MIYILKHSGRPKGEVKQKKAKDPNRPKRPTSAYFYFLADCRESAKKAGKSVSKVKKLPTAIVLFFRENDA